MATSIENEEFPWHIGVYDAHCHPTDINASTEKIPAMKARTLTLMATREEDQELVDSAAQKLGISKEAGPMDQSVRVVPAFGWHPWFSHLLFDDTQFEGKTRLNDDEKKRHYDKVLSPPAKDDSFINAPEEPIALSTMLTQLRDNLKSHPYALIGEIGIDRAFRIPEPWRHEDLATRILERTGGSREGRKLSAQSVTMEHQKQILEAQLRVAGEMQRAVSVHGVQAHGALYDVFHSLWKGHETSNRKRKKALNKQSEGTANENADSQGKPAMPFPPRVCLHSYSGGVDTLQQYFKKSVPADIFVSFSIAINFSTRASLKAEEVIKWVPEDRILIESDMHRAGEEMDHMLEQIARKICEFRGWELEKGVKIFAENWRHFAFGKRVLS